MIKKMNRASKLFTILLMYREIDKDEIFRVMHTSEATYSKIKEEEKEDFEEWMHKRDIAFLHSIKLNLIKSHPIIQVMYKRLVPSVTTETNFWNHYFYHMEKAGYDFSQPQDVLESVQNVQPVEDITPESNEIKDTIATGIEYEIISK